MKTDLSSFFIVSASLLVIYIVSFVILLTKVKSLKQTHLTLVIFCLLLFISNVLLILLFPERCYSEQYRELFVEKCYLLSTLILVCFASEDESYRAGNLVFYSLFSVLAFVLIAMDIHFFLNVEGWYIMIFKYTLLCLNLISYNLFMATVMKRLRGGKGQPSVLRLLEIIILSTMTLFLSAFYINYLLKGAYYTLYSVLFGVSAIVYLLILIYFYLKYPKRKEVMDSDEESLVIPRLFCEEDKFDDVIQRKLFELFEKDKPYLSPDITIGEVAFRLFTNKLYLSKILNLKIDKNFREFVNYYRVREAMELFINNPTISITDLCGLCGFRNVASFTNAFKIHSGYTPGEWCRQIKNRVQCEREEKYVVQT